MIEFIKNYMNTPEYLHTTGENCLMALIVIGCLLLLVGLFTFITYIICVIGEKRDDKEFRKNLEKELKNEKRRKN